MDTMHTPALQYNEYHLRKIHTEHMSPQDSAADSNNLYCHSERAVTGTVGDLTTVNLKPPTGQRIQQFIDKREQQERY
jgi:hypothetical protein